MADTQQLGMCAAHEVEAWRYLNGHSRRPKVKPGTKPGAATKPVCKRGHQRTGKNLNKSNACRACSYAASWTNKNPSAKTPIQEIADTYYQQIMEETS